jgi:hypothetical protein
LLARQFFALTDTHWRADVDKLVRTLENIAGMAAGAGRQLATSLLKRFQEEFADKSDLAEAVPLDDAITRYIPTEVIDRSDPQRKGHPITPGLFQQGSRTVLAGHGGSGKSLALLQIGMQAAQAAAVSSEAPIPLLGRLNAFDASENKFDEIVGLIANSSLVPRDTVDRLWRQENRPVLFLLDGLNEVAFDHRKHCVETLADEFMTGPHSYVVASRFTTETEDLAHRAKMHVLEVQPVGNNEIQQYLAKTGADGDQQRLGPAVQRLVSNPFMLWAYSRLAANRKDGEQAINRGHLYRELVDEYLFGTLESRKQQASRYSFEHVKKHVLARLAHRMTLAGKTREERSIPLMRSILQMLDELEADRRLVANSTQAFMPQPANAGDLIEEVMQNGVLRPSTAALEFTHESLQEYFTAVALVDSPPEAVLEPVRELSWKTVSEYDEDAREFVNRYPSSSYLEALVILSGLRSDATELVEKLTQRDLIAAARCLADASLVNESARNRLAAAITSALNAWHPNKRWIGARAALYSGLATEEIISLLGDIVTRESDWRTHEQAYNTLSAIAPERNPLTEKDWARLTVHHLVDRHAHMERSDGERAPSTYEALTDMRTNRERWNLAELVNTARSHWSVHVQNAARIFMGLEAEALDLVGSLAGSTDRVLAAEAAGLAMYLPAVPHLVRALRDPDVEMRVAALEALVQIRDDESLPAISAAAHSLFLPGQPITIQARVFRALTRTPIPADAMDAAAAALADMSRETESQNALGIIDAASALAEAGRAIPPELLDRLIQITKRGPDANTRAIAFDLVLRLPNGRALLMDAIHERLVAGDYQGVIHEIGADEPFVRSPNLVLWRAMAFYGISEYERAIEGAEWFVRHAQDPGAAGWSFLVTALHAAGQAERAEAARKQAISALSSEQRKKFLRLAGGTSADSEHNQSSGTA